MNNNIEIYNLNSFNNIRSSYIALKSSIILKLRRLIELRKITRVKKDYAS